jgi:acetyl esterase
MWEKYIANEPDRWQPEASPARSVSLAGLAPAMVIGAEHDYLCAEGEDYARRLEDAAVPTTSITYPGTIHGFFHLMGRFDESSDAVERVGDALRAVLQ